MRSLVEIQADVQSAKRRLGQLGTELYAIYVKYPCSLCGAEPGQCCRKGGVPGAKGRFAPYPHQHAERRRAAVEGEVLAKQRKKL